MSRSGPMDFAFNLVIPTHGDWGLITAGPRAHGPSADETIRIMSGNVRRVSGAAETAMPFGRKR